MIFPASDFTNYIQVTAEQEQEWRKKKPIKHQQLSIPQLAQLIKGCLGLM